MSGFSLFGLKPREKEENKNKIDKYLILCIGHTPGAGGGQTPSQAYHS